MYFPECNISLIIHAILIVTLFVNLNYEKCNLACNFHKLFINAKTAQIVQFSVSIFPSVNLVFYFFQLNREVCYWTITYDLNIPKKRYCIAVLVWYENENIFQFKFKATNILFCISVVKIWFKFGIRISIECFFSSKVGKCQIFLKLWENIFIGNVLKRNFLLSYLFDVSE